MEIGPPLVDVLARLPWFRDLSRDHRAKMLEDVAARLAVESSREEFTEVLLEWSRVSSCSATVACSTPRSASFARLALR